MPEEVEVSGYYPRLKEFIRQLDPDNGSMEFHPGGAGGGGVWVLTLHGRKARVPFHPLPNALDEMYEGEGKGVPLRADAFWRLIALFPGRL
jgi:hypothetical protein